MPIFPPDDTLASTIAQAAPLQHEGNNSIASDSHFRKSSGGVGGVIDDVIRLLVYYSVNRMWGVDDSMVGVGIVSIALTGLKR